MSGKTNYKKLKYNERNKAEYIKVLQVVPLRRIESMGKNKLQKLKSNERNKAEYIQCALGDALWRIELEIDGQL